ncbi:S8 family serine peptidase [Spirosoma montaniterrae]|uniref:Peptidase S8 n=1 Tax=Spirosoma montaniterrae TaxID=1178516 RepID=A0A1P9WVC2_9BACT|nr:S8 family serine peptidase [Spirosoma montaniterrae]AQG79324.1 peptidase S8 [Spirosoma montaniterrae]
MASDKSTASLTTASSKAILLLVVFLLTHTLSFSQTTTRTYLVRLRDKVSSPYSVSRPEQFLSQRSIQRRQKQNIAVLERDLPVNPAYVTQLQQAGAKVRFTSRWLNAVLIEATDATMTAVQRLPFVTGLEFNRALSRPVRSGGRLGAETDTKFGQVQTAINYGTSQTQITQLGVDNMHAAGFRGEGILIGVLDSGFMNADEVSFLKPLFDEKRILATYDFVKKETSVYEDDSHGTSCLAAIAATADGQLYGTAFKASFVLLRTEDADSEQQVEEANWLFGAEYADSAGVDVISSSLGYTTFDDPSQNYTYANMDGKTALCTRAAQIASETGMVVVVAAGNEGSNAWRYISAPSDAAGVLCIAAVNQTGQWASFSSIGPAADGRVKPDLAARGQGTIIGNPDGRIASGNGTSFATPLVAGLAAGFWQANSRLTAVQVVEALRRSGTQAGAPDAQLGYGIPNFARPLATEEPMAPFVVFPNPFSDGEPLTIDWQTINANASVDATLADLTGRTVWQYRYQPGKLGTLTVPSLNLSAGFYVMTIVSGDKRRVIKLLKR